MSHLQTKTKVLSDKTYRHVTGTAECRRNQFSLLKGRSQNIVHRLEHRFHEVTLWENIPRSFVFRCTVTRYICHKIKIIFKFVWIFEDTIL